MLHTLHIAKMTSSTDTEFSSALAYALSCVKRSHLVLRDKQLDTLRMLYKGNDVFLWVPTGYESLSATKLCLFYSTRSWIELVLLLVSVVLSPSVSNGRSSD